MTTECPIAVSVKTEYLPFQSEPAQSRYAFAYHITIANHGNQMVKLLSRHWRITDANNELQEVQGVGVVGQQPDIAPGASYHYSSGVMLKTLVGTMEGSYQMIGANGDEFDAPIPPFMLSVPGALH